MNDFSKPFLCLVCSDRFRRSDTLSKHIKLKHDTSKPFECSYESCNKSFAILQHLKRHKKTHEKNINIFVCSVCSEAFAKKSKLREHRKDAHNIAEFICMTDGCNKLFPSQSKLDAHKNTHKQRFMCLEPNCFVTMSNYFDFRRHKAYEHKNNQNNSNDNDVDLCQIITTTKKRKSRWDNDNTTTSSHDDNNNSINATFKCDIPGCVRSYVKMKNLKDHKRAVHNDVGARFSCTVAGCDQRYVLTFEFINEMYTFLIICL